MSGFVDTNMLVSPTQNCGVGGLSQCKDQTQIVLRRSGIYRLKLRFCIYSATQCYISYIFFDTYSVIMPPVLVSYNLHFLLYLQCHTVLNTSYILFDTYSATILPVFLLYKLHPLWFLQCHNTPCVLVIQVTSSLILTVPQYPLCSCYTSYILFDPYSATIPPVFLLYKLHPLWFLQCHSTPCVLVIQVTSSLILTVPQYPLCSCYTSYILFDSYSATVPPVFLLYKLHPLLYLQCHNTPCVLAERKLGPAVRVLHRERTVWKKRYSENWKPLSGYMVANEWVGVGGLTPWHSNDDGGHGCHT